MALWGLLTRPIVRCIKRRKDNQRLLTSAETCDLLKGTLWIIVSVGLLYVDTNMLYHLIKSQSIIKLYIFYNMLEVGDRLLSAFGQDIIDALFWTATEPKSNGRHLSVFGHFLFALIYVTIHSVLVMFQATSLNVAINSNSKGLLTIMMSNNFVELKGSVFKKFDKNNLFQLTCSDVRERFHLTALLLIVIIQTMREYDWKSEQFYVMLPDCLWVIFSEFLVDWIKHAFITRFNEIPTEVYKEYTISLAYDMTQTRQRHAFSDHSDLVARRMGFIAFPLGVVLVKALFHALTLDTMVSISIFVVAYCCVLSFRVLNTICTLGKACEIMQKHQEEKVAAVSTTSIIKIKPIVHKVDTATSPFHSNPILIHPRLLQSISSPNSSPIRLLSIKHQPLSGSSLEDSHLLKMDSTLGATALFSNSDVDLEDVHLNCKVLEKEVEDSQMDESRTHSEPDLITIPNESSSEDDFVDDEKPPLPYQRRHKRSESEPSIQLETATTTERL